MVSNSFESHDNTLQLILNDNSKENESHSGHRSDCGSSLFVNCGSERIEEHSLSANGLLNETKMESSANFSVDDASDRLVEMGRRIDDLECTLDILVKRIER